MSRYRKGNKNSLIRLSPAKKIFFQQRTNPEHVARHQAEAYHQQTQTHAQRRIYHKVLRMCLEKRTHHRHVRQENEVNQVHVQSALTYVLQPSAQTAFAGETVLVVAEEHEHYRQHREPAQCHRQVSPLHLQRVPLQRVKGAEGNIGRIEIICRIIELKVLNLTNSTSKIAIFARHFYYEHIQT